MSAPTTPGSFGSPDGRTCSTPETAGQAAYEESAKRWGHARPGGWSGLHEEERCDWEAVAQAAIAAAAPAPAAPGELAEQWFDGTFEDCSLTTRALAMDGFRAGWAARASAAPAPAAPAAETRCVWCSHTRGEHTGGTGSCHGMFIGPQPCKCTGFAPEREQPQAAPGLAAATPLGTAWRLLNETRDKLDAALADRHEVSALNAWQGSEISRLRTALSTLLDRTEGSSVLTGDERAEYQRVLGASAGRPGTEGQ